MRSGVLKVTNEIFWLGACPKRAVGRVTLLFSTSIRKKVYIYQSLTSIMQGCWFQAIIIYFYHEEHDGLEDISVLQQMLYWWFHKTHNLIHALNSFIYSVHYENIIDTRYLFQKTPWTQHLNCNNKETII